MSEHRATDRVDLQVRLEKFGKTCLPRLRPTTKQNKNLNQRSAQSHASNTSHATPTPTPKQSTGKEGGGDMQGQSRVGQRKTCSLPASRFHHELSRSLSPASVPRNHVDHSVLAACDYGFLGPRRGHRKSVDPICEGDLGDRRGMGAADVSFLRRGRREVAGGNRYQMGNASQEGFGTTIFWDTSCGIQKFLLVPAELAAKAGLTSSSGQAMTMLSRAPLYR